LQTEHDEIYKKRLFVYRMDIELLSKLVKKFILFLITVMYIPFLRNTSKICSYPLCKLIFTCKHELHIIINEKWVELAVLYIQVLNIQVYVFWISISSQLTICSENALPVIKGRKIWEKVRKIERSSI
jgi:hypothetical protein